MAQQFYGVRHTDRFGYELPEVVSAIQKAIRRGKEKEAMFWALEMCPHYEGYLWRRLIDPGMANADPSIKLGGAALAGTVDDELAEILKDFK